MRVSGVVPSDLTAEHLYAYQERLGLLGVFNTPPADLHNQAVEAADQHCRELREIERESWWSRYLGKLAAHKAAFAALLARKH